MENWLRIDTFTHETRLHVCFDKWMDKFHPEKPFERYADDVVVHCKTEKQAIFMLKQIDARLRKCNLTLHPEKTKIVNVKGKSEKKYPKSYDFLGFTIRPQWVKAKGKPMLLPSMFMSRKSKKQRDGKVQGTEHPQKAETVGNNSR
jgi:RNA-directed DNA polymerase